ncbi:MAG: 16S rRNA (uracil(1498)-N(3))-methyltransferase [Chitinophagaceae bacterium]|nr:16S rRNA (uracil(1498)-N(3))-methyltransferase [Chitinophagaceae bacterium]
MNKKLPYFFQSQLQEKNKQFTLSEETSKHCVRVLRMQVGEQLQLTSGIGDLYTVEIIDAHKNACVVKQIQFNKLPPKNKQIAIAISPLKNTSRFEWFLEKSTELGISTIIPIICKRTEKQHFKFERMQNILIAAMLQSQQCYVPQLLEAITVKDFINQAKQKTKLIAHCLEEEKKVIQNFIAEDVLMMIGPEGDFTPDEIELAIQHQFIPVSLGETRLRTETAGVVAATLLQLG